MHTFCAHPVAPQEAAIGQVGCVALGQLGEAVGVHIAFDGAQQLGLVGRAVASRRGARARQYAQGELHFQGVGICGQGSNIHGLQVGVFDGGIELGWVLVFGLQAVRNGAAHRLLADGDGCPGTGAFVGVLAVGPESCVEHGVRGVELALEGQDRCGSEFFRHGFGP